MATSKRRAHRSRTVQPASGSGASSNSNSSSSSSSGSGSGSGSRTSSSSSFTPGVTGSYSAAAVSTAASDGAQSANHAGAPSLAELLMIGTDRVIIDDVEDENLHFMADYIDPA